MSQGKSIVFKRTDELNALLKNMLTDYYKDRGENVRKDELRRQQKRLLDVIERGAKRIKANSVASR